MEFDRPRRGTRVRLYANNKFRGKERCNDVTLKADVPDSPEHPFHIARLVFFFTMTFRGIVKKLAYVRYYTFVRSSTTHVLDPVLECELVTKGMRTATVRRF